MNRKSVFHSYWFFYTVSFAAVSALVFLPFFLGGYSFVNRTDGLNQQYVSLLYFHRWGRAVWEKMVSSHSFSLQMWDLNIGLGNPVVSTAFFCISLSPFSLGAILCPEEWLEYFYAFEFLARLFLAGAAFSAFARYQKQPGGGYWQAVWPTVFAGLYCRRGFSTLSLSCR